MTSPHLDPRVTPARPDLAADTLRGEVEAERFVTGERRTVVAGVAPLRRTPRADASLATEALHGETALVFEVTEDGWSWVQLERDGYVGYVPSHALGPFEPATAKVAVLRSHIYPGPDLKLPTEGALPLGARCRLGRVVNGFAAIADGYAWAGHFVDPAWAEPDFVAVAERFLGVPYLWGGKSSLGLDCSGLVQVAMAAAGREVPRDSDMQALSIGSPLLPDASLQRGDLVFWPGHVGIMRDPQILLHANARAMLVTAEPLEAAQARIKSATGQGIALVRRPG